MNQPSDDTARRSVTGCPAYDYAPGQPNLFLMMRYKQELVRRHGVTDGFAHFRHTFGLPATARLRPTTVAEARAVAEREATFFVETGRAGDPFVHQPPAVVGESNHRPVAGTTRSEYVARFDDALVRGRSALLDVRGQLLLDVQTHEVGRLDDEIEWDPGLFHADGRSVWGIDHADAEQPLEVEEAFWLLGAHTDFFGHWMYEYLPKYTAARLSGLMPDVPVLIDAHMPSSHRASLELLYGLCGSLIEIPAFRTVRVPRLWCAPTLSYMPVHDIRNERFNWEAMFAPPDRFEPVIQEMQRRFDRYSSSGSVGAKRIYLARKAFRHRKLVNHAAIEDVARMMAFDVVYPEDLSFADQAALARQATIIVAPEGSAVYLAFFARRGTTLCILSHPMTDGLAEYNGLLEPHDVAVTVVTGPLVQASHSTPHDSDYSIDERTFRGVVEGLLHDMQ